MIRVGRMMQSLRPAVRRCRIRTSRVWSRTTAVPSSCGSAPLATRAQPVSPEGGASGIAKLAPGVVASAAVMQAGFMGAEVLGQALLTAQGLDPSGPCPVSGIPVAILTGLALRNTLPAALLPVSRLEPGLKFCTTTVLRAGIVCVGAKLSAAEMVSLGVAGVPAVLLSMGAGLAYVTWAGARAGLPPRLSSLIAAGTSVCGVTAISALAPAIGANQREVSYAVANVVAFGTFGMLCYPYLAHSLVDHSEQVGILLGLSIHDTSQVMAAALTYREVFGDELALKTAAITKLTRNVFLAGVIPGLTIFTASRTAACASGEDAGGQGAGGGAGDRGSGGSGKSSKGKSSLLSWSMLKKSIPLFVLGFIAAACVRSGGDAMLERDGLAYGAFDREQWESVTKTVGNKIGGRYALGTAMAAVGLSTSTAVFQNSGLGVKPFLVGSSGALVVGFTALSTALALEKFGFLPTTVVETVVVATNDESDEV